MESAIQDRVQASRRLGSTAPVFGFLGNSGNLGLGVPAASFPLWKVFPRRDSRLAGGDGVATLRGQNAGFCDRAASNFCSQGEETVRRPQAPFPGFCFVFITGRFMQKQKPKPSGPCAEMRRVVVCVTAALLQQPDNIIASLFLLGNQRKSILVLLILVCRADQRPDCTYRK